MMQIKEKHNCSGCSACFNICPKQCIEMKADEEGFVYPVVDQTKCINCGLCEKICPIINKCSVQTGEPKTFACINRNEEIRMKSSSGGAFSAFAEYVLENDGVVFGAGFDENFMVCHQYCQSKDELDKLRTSKYVQSSIGDSFKLARQFLNEGRMVLFTGTACQIGGLKAFLRKDYDNLITQDVICHGVPSPIIWKKYLDYKIQQHSLKLAKVCFRDKSSGWQRFSLSMHFKGEEGHENVYKKKFTNEPFMNMFIFNKILRPSCHKCSFKGISRQADITLADFWGGGFKKYAPQMNDNKGCSLVIIHSEKGLKIFEKLADKLEAVEVPYKRALKGNSMARKSALKSPRRKYAMKNINKIPFDKYVKKYGKIIF